MAIENIKFKDLTQSSKALIQEAKTIMHNAYNIYSHFYVGASARSKSGKIFTGTNVENASLGLTICAEPAALLQAFSEGEPEIVEMAVVGGTSPEMEGGNIATPCGRCRQIIYEVSQISKTDIVIYCCNPDLSKVKRTTISDLLPLPFGPDDLDKGKEMNKYLKRFHS